MKGLGKGMVGTIVKPVDKVNYNYSLTINNTLKQLGQAVSSMASGIRAEYVTKPLGGYKFRTERRRKPRMLWGDSGHIRCSLK